MGGERGRGRERGEGGGGEEAACCRWQQECVRDPSPPRVKLCYSTANVSKLCYSCTSIEREMLEMVSRYQVWK